MLIYESRMMFPKQFLKLDKIIFREIMTIEHLKDEIELFMQGFNLETLQITDKLLQDTKSLVNCITFAMKEVIYYI